MNSADKHLQNLGTILAIIGGLSIGGYILALALGFAVYVLAFLATVGVGVAGFSAAKLKIPLVNPNGPIVVPIVYSLIWALVITAALILGSSVLGGYFPVGHRPSDLTPYERSVNDPIRNYQAAFFLIEFWLVLLASLGIRRSGSMRLSFSVAGAAISAAAALLFSVSPDIGGRSILNAVYGIGSTIVSPVTLPRVLAQDGGVDLAHLLYEWLLSTKGNLFTVMKEFAKVLWIVALLRFAFAWLRKLVVPASNTAQPSYSAQLSYKEWRIFWTAAASAFVIVVTFVAVIGSVGPEGMGSGPATIFGAVIVIVIPMLLLNLWRSRQYISG